jgi:hypothetical protein
MTRVGQAGSLRPIGNRPSHSGYWLLAAGYFFSHSGYWLLATGYFFQ